MVGLRTVGRIGMGFAHEHRPHVEGDGRRSRRRHGRRRTSREAFPEAGALTFRISLSRASCTERTDQSAMRRRLVPLKAQAEPVPAAGSR